MGLSVLYLCRLLEMFCHLSSSETLLTCLHYCEWKDNSQGGLNQLMTDWPTQMRQTDRLLNVTLLAHASMGWESVAHSHCWWQMGGEVKLLYSCNAILLRGNPAHPIPDPSLHYHKPIPYTTNTLASTFAQSTQLHLFLFSQDFALITY